MEYRLIVKFLEDSDDLRAGLAAILGGQRPPVWLPPLTSEEVAEYFAAAAGRDELGTLEQDG